MTSEILDRGLATPLFDGASLTVGDFLSRLRLSGTWAAELVDLARGTAVVQIARSKGLAPTDEQLQRGVDRFREERELHGAAETQGWLDNIGASLDDLEHIVEIELCEESLRGEITESEIESQYKAARSEFKSGTLDANTREQILHRLVSKAVDAYLENHPIRERNIWSS